MRIGLFLGLRDILPRLSDHVEMVVEAEADGFDSFWLPQVFGADVLTVIAIAGERTKRIELGTAVVPTFPRHPVVLAQQALTAQAATGGRLTLGVGVSHKSTIEDWLGLSYDRPASHMKEYLSVLRPLLNEEGVNFVGNEFRVNAALQVPDAMTCPVLVSALGPRMLAIAGELGDGAIVWMTGPKTIETHVVPHLNNAADAAGRPRPRVCVGVAIAVTDNPDGARERAGRLFRSYDVLPSYRRMLEIEGAEGPPDMAIVGNEAAVEQQLRSLANSGATDLLAAIFPVDEGPASIDRTRALLLSLIGTL
jgi:F420-dependent oxidoreductase-like protein